jgi:hypothetical protein
MICVCANQCSLCAVSLTTSASTAVLQRHEANLDLEEECLQFVSTVSDETRKMIMDQLQITLDSIKRFEKKYGVWRRMTDPPVPMPTPIPKSTPYAGPTKLRQSKHMSTSATPEEPKTPTQTHVPLPSNLQA